MADPIRLIKKYPNRRLYDTQTSSYITLADVKELVLEHGIFRSSTPSPAKTSPATSCCRSSSKRRLVVRRCSPATCSPR
jgi:hypothetical protein